MWDFHLFWGATYKYQRISKKKLLFPRKFPWCISSKLPKKIRQLLRKNSSITCILAMEQNVFFFILFVFSDITNHVGVQPHLRIWFSKASSMIEDFSFPGKNLWITYMSRKLTIPKRHIFFRQNPWNNLFPASYSYLSNNVQNRLPFTWILSQSPISI